MYVKSVTLEGIKKFKDLQFDFKRPNGRYAGWTVFLGGNASGKSTILKSIALALAGPGRFLRRHSPCCSVWRLLVAAAFSTAAVAIR